MTLTGIITSTANPRIKQVRKLQRDRRYREQQGCFVIEGFTLLNEALVAQAAVDEVLYTPQFEQDAAGVTLLNSLRGQDVELVPVTEDVMRSMAETRTPQGILAIAPIPRLSSVRSPSFGLIADAVHDPGNMGTIMRLSAGAAVPVLFLASGSVDIYNPKVVRSAMGAHFRIAVVDASWEEIKDRLASHTIYLADSRGGVPYFGVDWVPPCALIVSDEANGASPDAVGLASMRVTIPMPGRLESLNVAVATGILVYEMVRQRSLAASQKGSTP